MEDQLYMRRCIELALKAAGRTFPNPLVGAVIVHNGKIIGEGYHHKAGDPHAEINAINSVKDQSLLPESTIYVSLEPCSHFGKTPPCAAKLIEKHFARVVIGVQDAHEKVNGNGTRMLREAGIAVTTDVLEAECRELNKRFFTFHTKKRPYIILKWAQSADGFIDRNYQRTGISNPLASQWVHDLRSREHAILVGTATALSDDPSLTVRHVEGRHPVRILIDFDLKVPADFKILNHESPTLIFNSKKSGEEGHLTYIQTGKSGFTAVLMRELYDRQIQSVLVEGGRYTLEHFIREDLWDEAAVITNRTLNLHTGTKAPQFDQLPKKTVEVLNNNINFYRNV